MFCVWGKREADKFLLFFMSSKKTEFFICKKNAFFNFFNTRTATFEIFITPFFSLKKKVKNLLFLCFQ
jgi:hypothetical protein